MSPVCRLPLIAPSLTAAWRRPSVRFLKKEYNHAARTIKKVDHNRDERTGLGGVFRKRLGAAELP